MNRCTPNRLAAICALAASSALATLPAHAQSTGPTPIVRHFPAAALRAEMVVLTPSTLTLDGKADRLSPGARIRGMNNMLVMSARILNQPLVVNYVRESAGLVHEVWILNSEEIKQKRPNTQSSWFSFSSPEAPASASAR